MNSAGPRPPFPDRKISETFLDFASPVLGDGSEEPRDSQLGDALRVAFSIWNAVVYADVLDDQHFLDEIRAATGGQLETAAIIELLIARKRELFADDPRLIGQWDVFLRDGALRLRADARDPYSVERQRR